MASSVLLFEANTVFSLDLLKKLSDEDKAGNIFFSPFSISSALAMVMLGARGNTATQMSQCLRTENIVGNIHVGFAHLLSELNQADAPYTLSLANRLYGEQSFQFSNYFLGQIKQHYNAELESVNFKTSAEAARLNINGWVADQTQGKIKDLLAKGMLNAKTILVLVNAIYFKGNWNEQFKESDTHDAQFRVTKDFSKQVKMMGQETMLPLNIIPEVNCQILEMPYKGKEVSMLIFLPDDMKAGTTGLERLEQELTYENFVKWTSPSMMATVKVSVKLPRFKMEETYSLNEVLTSMGMVDAFNKQKCDFSGMSSGKGLSLSSVVHKAFVEVNEEGTEAAAATAGIITLTSLPPTFIADHPFLFFIRHNPSMTILFAGRYCSP